MPVHHFVRAIGNYHSLLHYISLSQGTSKRTLLLLSPALLHVAMLWHRRPEIAVVSHCSLGHCVRQDFAQGWGWMTTYFNARIDAYHDNALRHLRKVLATSQWTQRLWPTAVAWFQPGHQPGAQSSPGDGQRGARPLKLLPFTSLSLSPHLYAAERQHMYGMTSLWLLYE